MIRPIDPQTPGQRLKDLRLRHDLSQRDLAKLIGGDHRSIGRLENDQKSIETVAAGTVYRLAKVLGTTVEYLLAGDASNITEGADKDDKP